MMAEKYVVTACKSRKSAEQTKKWYAKHDVPVTIDKVNEHRYLLIADRAFRPTVQAAY